MHRRATSSLLRAPVSFASLQQKPLYPGQSKMVKRFDGEHVYSHAAQNIQAFKEAKAYFIAAASILMPFAPYAYFGSWAAATAAGATLASLGPAMVVYPSYACAVLACLRVAAAGKRNALQQDFSGKKVLILGGTGDIGRVVAKRLLEMGATVIIASHSDEAKVEATREFLKGVSDPLPIKKKGASSNATENNDEEDAKQQQQQPKQRLFFKHIDLAYLSSIRLFCRTLKDEHRTLHMIVNCSGVMYNVEKINKYGDEEQLSTNALGPYLLIESLLPQIAAARGRIIHVTSSAHVTCSDKVVKKYLSHKRGLWQTADDGKTIDGPKFDGLEQYGFTKLCNLFHAQSLAERAYEKESFSEKQLETIFGVLGGVNKATLKKVEGSVFIKPASKTTAPSSSSPSKLVINKLQIDAGKANAAPLGISGASEPLIQIEGEVDAPSTSTRPASIASSSIASIASSSTRPASIASSSTRPASIASTSIASSSIASSSIASIASEETLSKPNVGRSLISKREQRKMETAQPAPTLQKGEEVQGGENALFTVCAVNPGGVITHLFRHMPSAALQGITLPYVAPFFSLFMKTPEDGAQTILYCCCLSPDEFVNGGYYQNCAHAPNALSSVACSKQERELLMEWVKNRTRAVMDRQQFWKPKVGSTAGDSSNKLKKKPLFEK